MTRAISLICPLAISAVALFAVGCTSTTDNVLLTRPQSVAWNVDPAIPNAVRAPQGHVLLGHAIGRGVATFTLQEDAIHRRAWVVTNDEGGNLYDDTGDRIGSYSGNTWSDRQGQLTAEPVARIPQTRSAPWALLEATSHSGHGLMGGAQFIEQIHTVGGPAAARKAADLGSQVRAEYSADYYFYGGVPAQTRIHRGGNY